MARFSDSGGNSWELSLTIGAVARVRSATNKRIDLLKPDSEVEGRKLFDLLLDDPVEAWAVIWHVIEPQAIERGITAEKFGELMAADCMLEAQEVFLMEWTDFFQKSQRADEAAALGVMIRAKRKLRTTLTARVAQMDMTATDKALEAKIETAIGEACTALQGSLESIQAG